MTVLSVIAIASSLGAKPPVSERGELEAGVVQKGRALANARGASSILVPGLSVSNLEMPRSETCDSARKAEGGDACDRSALPAEQRSESNRRVTPPGCADARRGLAFYKARARYWAHKMGAGRTPRSGPAGISRTPCPQIHRAVTFWRAKAKANRLRYERWAHDWAWRAWLPAKWYRIARCETGVRWDWNSGAYQGAFGFAVSSWDAFRLPGYPSEAYEATPREQYEVALAIWRRFGYSGWGCRNA